MSQDDVKVELTSKKESPQDASFLDIFDKKSVQDELQMLSSARIETKPELLTYKTISGGSSTFGNRTNLTTLLYGAKQTEDIEDDKEENLRKLQAAEQEDKDKRTFGIWDGVFARCLLNIFGVIMFLRLGYIIGGAGLGLAMVIILISGAITLATSFSLAAITTNGEVQGGGAYFMISRALGPAFGGSIGIMFSVANAISVSMYIVGFADTVIELMTKANINITPGGAWDIQVIGLATLVFVFFICIVGMCLVVKIQLGLLVVLIVCIISVFIGSGDKPDLGVSAPRVDYIRENFAPDFALTLQLQSETRGCFANQAWTNTNYSGNFMDVAAYMRASECEKLCGGMDFDHFAMDTQALCYCGLNAPNQPMLADKRCVDLPGVDVWQITPREFEYDNISGFFFMLSIFFPAVTGIMAGANISGELRDPHRDIPVGTNLAVIISTFVYLGLAVMMAATCTRHSLENNYIVIAEVSAWAPLIYAGIFSATLSSAIASFVGAPRVLMAVAEDKLFPGLEIFARVACGYEPVYGYLLTFVISAVCILIGDLNAIAPLISGFFMISYAFINFACFCASYARSPGWRPTFKMYNKWVALLSALICMVILFLLNVITGVVTLFVGTFLYLYLHCKDIQEHWVGGSTLPALSYNQALKAINALDKNTNHVKNYRPQILILSGPVEDRRGLVLFSQDLKKSRGLFVYGHVLVNETIEDLRTTSLQEAHQELRRLREKANVMTLKNGFVEVTLATSVRQGAQTLLQMSGISKIRPNVVMFGYQNFLEKTEVEVKNYVDMIRDSFFLNYAVMIVRNWEKMYSEEKLASKRNGTVDVWWLYDDGGLTVLLPHLLKLHKRWKDCNIRIMTMGLNDEAADAQVLAQMSNLINKIRIPATIVPVQMKVNVMSGMVPDLGPEITRRYMEARHPSEKKADEQRKSTPTEDESGRPRTKSEVEIDMPRRSKRHLRVAELVQEYSSDAECVFITMPVPEVNLDQFEYMRWLDALSGLNVPTVLIRGNQETVITFDL